MLFQSRQQPIMVGRVRPMRLDQRTDSSRLLPLHSQICTFTPCTTHASTHLPICSWTTVAASSAAKRFSSRRSICPSRHSFAGWSKGRRSAGPCRSCRGSRTPCCGRSIRSATEESMKLAGELERARMEQMHAYIGIRGAANSSQFADVPQRRWTSTSSIGGKRFTPTIRVAEDEMGRAALSDRFVRPSGQHEHGGVRRFLFRRLHGRLRGDGRRPRSRSSRG